MKRFFCWLFRIHYCDFDKWQLETLRFARPVGVYDGNLYTSGETMFEYSKCIQKRRCKKCGLTEIKHVSY